MTGLAEQEATGGRLGGGGGAPPKRRLKQAGDFHIEPATIKGYKDIFSKHVKNNKVANIRLRNFHTADGQAFLESLSPELSHQTHLRIKAFMSGVFSLAKQSKVIEGVNPMDDTKAGGKSKTSLEPHAFTFAELKKMFKVLPEPAKTVCAVAAFTGLTESELRGLRWEDYDGKSIHVRQKIWRTYVGPPKTKARKSSIPVIPLLRDILAQCKKEFPPTSQGFIFAGEKKGFALSLDNLSRRDISPILDGGWHGWHSFRRGLGTRLFALGEDAQRIQMILRHANVSMTQAHYIIPDAESARQTMGRYADSVKVLGSFWIPNKSSKQRKTA
jgi:integrase